MEKNFILLNDFEKHNIITDINYRWENGIDHHPMSIKIMAFISDFDFLFADDYFCWKSGGDGDNGEFLMYELDVFFELLDKEKSCV